MSFSHLTFSAADAWRTDNAPWRSNPLVNSSLKSCRNTLIKSNTESLSVSALDRSVLEQTSSAASVFLRRFFACWSGAQIQLLAKHKGPITDPGIPVGTERRLENTSQEFLLQGLPPKPRWVRGEPEKSLGLITARAGAAPRGQGTGRGGTRTWKENERETRANLKEKPHKTSQQFRLSTCADVYWLIPSFLALNEQYWFFSGCCRASSARFKAGH